MPGSQIKRSAILIFAAVCPILLLAEKNDTLQQLSAANREFAYKLYGALKEQQGNLQEYLIHGQAYESRSVKA